MPAALKTLDPPATINLLLEGGRAIHEFGALLGAVPLLSLLPRGDGHPVIVFPGLLASDSSTKPLRIFLEGRGYNVCGWGCGWNRGLRDGDGLQEQMLDLIEKQYSRHARKVSLVGWSLGGIYARQLAKILPDKVRCVVTLGSPFAGSPRSTHAWRTYEWASGQSAEQSPPEFAGSLVEPPPVPTTAIFSRSDGICAWQGCVEETRSISESIEVHGSHCGMGFNPFALYAVADRLAQPEHNWRPFRKDGWKAIFFPSCSQ
jgi:pimeloyl-ACP methyl ester carboxylesterase